MADVQKIFEQMSAAVKTYVSAATAPLTDRIKALEERPPIAGPQGEKGMDGAIGPQGERGEKG
jgi:hypothetical protein